MAVIVEKEYYFRQAKGKGDTFSQTPQKESHFHAEQKSALTLCWVAITACQRVLMTAHSIALLSDTYKQSPELCLG